MKSKKHRFELTLTNYQRHQLDALIEKMETSATDVLITALAVLYHDRIGAIESNEKRVN